MEYLLPVLKGLATYVPGLMYIRTSRIAREKATAEYSYNIWLKHLIMLHQQEGAELPRVVAELGPGGSLGVGLAALLSGASTYHALDVIRHIHTAQNLEIFDQLVSLFQAKTPLTTDGWPPIKGHLGQSGFPDHILTDVVLAESLKDERIRWLRDEISCLSSNGDCRAIRYTVPWDDPAVIDEGSVDLILSHAVLEHVSDIDSAYAAMSLWLRPGGWMSHQIDFRSHNLTKEWNGHWAYPRWLWLIIVGRRPYLINREPHSRHVRAIHDAGCDVKYDMLKLADEGMPRRKLSTEWRDISDEDYRCAEAFIQAQKRNEI